MRTFRPFIAVVASVAVLAACGGGGGDDKSSAKKKSTTTAAAPPSTETTVAPGTAPLTGAPAADPAKLARPALVVKIDNAPKARPQAGINQADLVVEEAVEGGVTRLFVVFHSQDADPVGPVRSSRSTDLALAVPLNRPLFAYSGTNSVFQKQIAAAPVIDISPNAFPGGYRRQPGRPSPYNLFSSTPTLFSKAPAGASGPPALFSYRPAGAAPTGGEAAGAVTLEFPGRVLTTARWTWDAASGTYRRTQRVSPTEGAATPHVDAAGQPVAPRNVVIALVNYTDTGIRDQSGEPVPEAHLEGEGEAWVLTGGTLIKGKWRKTGRDARIEIVDGAGKPIPLTPGQTWMELPRPGGAKVG